MAIEYTTRIFQEPGGKWVGYLSAAAHCANGVLKGNFEFDADTKKSVTDWLEFMKANLVVVPLQERAKANFLCAT